MDYIVTTTIGADKELEDCAYKYACTLGVPYVRRGKESLQTVKKKSGVDCLVVVSKNGPRIVSEGGEYFFHLSMADLRIKNIKNGKHDHMIAAMELGSDMTVLDCTLGLGTDAIVASYVAGPRGAVIGLESSPAVAFITKWGLANYICEDADVTEALRRISVHQINYNEYLPLLPAKSFDVVYFDPMFRHPIYSSSSIKPIRYVADGSLLTLNAVHEAVRVAKKRVVIKDSARKSELKRLGISKCCGGRYSSVSFGIIDVGGRHG